MQGKHGKQPNPWKMMHPSGGPRGVRGVPEAWVFGFGSGATDLRALGGERPIAPWRSVLRLLEFKVWFFFGLKVGSFMIWLCGDFWSQGWGLRVLGLGLGDLGFFFEFLCQHGRTALQIGCGYEVHCALLDNGAVKCCSSARV